MSINKDVLERIRDKDGVWSSTDDTWPLSLSVQCTSYQHHHTQFTNATDISLVQPERGKASVKWQNCKHFPGYSHDLSERQCTSKIAVLAYVQM